MRAVQVAGTKASPDIVLTDSLPKPVPSGRGVLVRVRAAAITGDEVSWPELYSCPSRVPGHDVSGVVEALGPAYDGPLAPGDGVYAMLRPAADQGAQADYVVAAPGELAAKPASLSHAQAAALPIPVLTAWEALFEHAALGPGSRVLVTGASGAVGVMLVQLASRLLGAHVTGLAAPHRHAFVAALGASRVLDYAAADWHSSVRGVDAVLDTVGGATLSRAWDTVRPGVVVVTVADPTPPWAFGRARPDELRAHPDVRPVYFIVTARGDTLTRAAAMLDDGSLEPLPVKAFPADQALDAWAYARQRGRQAKAVVEFSTD